MAEDEIADIVGDTGKQQTQDIKDDWKQISGGKFKSEAELAKAYKDLEKKLGEVSEEVKQSKEFAQIVNPILTEIQNDKEIFDKLDKKIREKNDPEFKDKKDEKFDNKNVNAESRETLSNIIVAGFEQKHGFSELTADEATKLRKSIGDEILSITGKRLADIDLRTQGVILEKAYKLVKAESQQSSQDETEDTQQNNGAIGKIKSSQGKGQTVLTSEQAQVAEGLGLTREQYLAGIKK